MASPIQVLTGSGLTAAVFPVAWLSVLTPPRPCYPVEAQAWCPLAAVLIDGPMFVPCRGEPDDYDTYQCGRTETLLIDPWTGAAEPGWMPRQGATFARVGGELFVGSGARFAPGADLLLQGRPELVRDGRVVASPSIDTDTTGRAALVRLRDGRVACVVGRMGMHRFATLLVAVLGALDAFYLDGGGSTALLVGGVAIGGTRPRARRVPSYLAAIDPQLRALYPALRAE